MDYTLAAYNTEFDLLAFNGALAKLVLLGYPKEVLKFKYVTVRRCCCSLPLTARLPLLLLLP